MYVRMQVSINPRMRLLAYVSTVGAHIGTYSAAVAAGAAAVGTAAKPGGNVEDVGGLKSSLLPLLSLVT